MKMTSEKILEMLDKAVVEINKVAGNDYYVDDVRWGDDRFVVPVFKCDDKFSESEYVCEFYFRYDDDDFFGRSADEQLKDEIENFVDRYFN